MAIQDTLNNVKAKLDKLQRDRRFKKANLAREEKVAMQTASAMCAGDLAICRREFERIIRQQSRNIREGEVLGADTLVQEQMLWDAAIGYMLVGDAIFALKTINNHSSIAHAYEMMDLAAAHMSGKKSKLPLKQVKDRNVYGFLTSSAAYEAKSELLNTFFEDLKATGDIEGCLNSARRPVQREATLRNDYASDSLPQRDPEAPSGGSDAWSRLEALGPQDDDNMDFTPRRNPRATSIDFGDGT